MAMIPRDRLPERSQPAVSRLWRRTNRRHSRSLEPAVTESSRRHARSRFCSPRVHMSKHIVAGVATIALLAWATVSQAQDTREATITQQQAEKAKNVRPYEPGRAEAALLRAQELLITPSGFYPY